MEQLYKLIEPSAVNSINISAYPLKSIIVYEVLLSLLIKNGELNCLDKSQWLLRCHLPIDKKNRTAESELEIRLVGKVPHLHNLRDK